MSVRKVHQSSIVVMPPKALWDAIQRIRAVHDRQFKRWPPHINMVYPFMPDSQFGEASAELAKGLLTVKPFKISLSKFGFFKQSAYSTMWLGPDVEPSDGLLELQKSLVKVFPNFNDVAEISSTGFKPHLSVGQAPNAKEAKKLIDEFEASWTPIEWTVTEVYMISRQGFDAPFEVRQICLFGGVSEPTGGFECVPIPAPAELEAKVDPKGERLFVGNLPLGATREDLLAHFAPFGPTDAIIATAPGGKSRNFGFVWFPSRDPVVLVAAPVELGGRLLNLDWSDNKGKKAVAAAAAAGPAPPSP